MRPREDPESGVLSLGVLDGVDVDGVGGIFPFWSAFFASSFFSFFFAFLCVSSLCFVSPRFLRFSSILSSLFFLRFLFFSAFFLRNFFFFFAFLSFS